MMSVSKRVLERLRRYLRIHKAPLRRQQKRLVNLTKTWQRSRRNIGSLVVVS
jgi:hypothetical protein